MNRAGAIARSGVLMALLLSGCGDDASSDPPQPSTTAERSTTTTGTEPALREAASIVGRSRQELLDGLRSFDECGPLDQPCDPVVVGDMLSTSFEAEVLGVRLRGLDRVPDEIADLVADTASAAETLREAMGTYVDGDCPGDPSCVATLLDVGGAASRLAAALGGWEPYL